MKERRSWSDLLHEGRPLCAGDMPHHLDLWPVAKSNRSDASQERRVCRPCRCGRGRWCHWCPARYVCLRKKLGHLKVQKVHTFLSHSAAKELLLVWVVVTAPIMVLHYYLFRQGRFRNPHDRDAEVMTVFDFVDNVASNRLVATVCALCAMLMEPTGRVGSEHLRLLFLKHGRLAEWPQRVTVALQVSLVLAIAWIWRKLILHLSLIHI